MTPLFCPAPILQVDAFPPTHAAGGHLLLSFVPVALSAATVSHVQSNYATPQSPQTTVTVAFLGAQIAGDLNVVVGWNDTSATVTGVVDQTGNTYAPAVGPTAANGLSQSIYYAKNIAAAAAGANRVTVTFSTAAAYPDVRIVEYSGSDRSNPIDVAAASSGNNASSSSGSATTTNSIDLLFGANIVATLTSGPGSGFTARLLTSPDGDIAEDRTVRAATAPRRLSPHPGRGSCKWLPSVRLRVRQRLVSR